MMEIFLKFFRILTVTWSFSYVLAVTPEKGWKPEFRRQPISDADSSDDSQCFGDDPKPDFGDASKPESEQLYQTGFSSALGKGCKPDCPSEIYCHGEVLHDIEMARLYPDSKTFVDKKLLFPEKDIVAKYRSLKSKAGGKLTPDQLKQFIDENFVDDALDPWEPSDLQTNPALASRINDPDLRKWFLDMNLIWKELAGKIPSDVQKNPDRHSYLWIPNGFIKAGGRFREIYYWDSYWIVKGLLLTGMTQTARGVIENIIYLVKQHGHMPNGNRKYYLQRSQPPFLIQMAVAYQAATKDDKFIKDNLQYFEKEFQYWCKNRFSNVKLGKTTYQLARYDATACTPRPESYYEDYMLAANISDLPLKYKVYTGMKSAAESGWDFSSRHIVAKDGTNKGTLQELRTQNLLYVDLNCLLHANAVALSVWYKSFGAPAKSQYYTNIANKLFNAINQVLWNSDEGMWFDYDPSLNKHRKYYYSSNLFPLWTNSYPADDPSYIQKSIAYLTKEGIIKDDQSPVYIAIPASKINSGQQWDFPNCWTPNNAIVIQGLERSGDATAKSIAFKMAQSWIHTTYTGFKNQGFMFEKYSALQLGTTGAGGEYVPQKGFGWTNGFSMELLNTYGKDLKTE